MGVFGNNRRPYAPMLLALFGLPVISMGWASAEPWASERTMVTPLEEKETKQVAPILAFIDEIPLPMATAGANDSEKHLIELQQRRPGKSTLVLIQHEGLTGELTLDPERAGRTTLLRYARTRSNNLPTRLAWWRSFAALADALLTEDPSLSVHLRDILSRAHDSRTDGHSQSMEATREGDTIHIESSRNWGGEKSSIAFKAGTLEFLGGSQVVMDRKEAFQLFDTFTIPAGEDEPMLLTRRVRDVHSGRQLWIKSDGIFEATGVAFPPNHPDEKKLEWKRIKQHKKSLAKGTASYHAHISKFMTQMAKRREEEQKRKSFKRAVKFAGEKLGQPNRIITDEMHRLLAKAPPGTTLQVKAKVLHQGMDKPVRFYSGRSRGDEFDPVQVWYQDGPSIRDITVVDPPSALLNPVFASERAWQDELDVRKDLMKLVQLVGKSLVTLEPHGPVLFGKQSYYAFSKKRGQIETGNKSRKISKHEIIFDRRLRPVAGTVHTANWPSQLELVTSDYALDRYLMGHLTKIAWMLYEEDPYDPTDPKRYRHRHLAHELNVDKDGIHLGESYDGREVVKWKTLMTRSELPPFGLNNQGMHILEDFKARKYPALAIVERVETNPPLKTKRNRKK